MQGNDIYHLSFIIIYRNNPEMTFLPWLYTAYDIMTRGPQ